MAELRSAYLLVHLSATGPPERVVVGQHLENLLGLGVCTPAQVAEFLMGDPFKPWLESTRDKERE